MTRRPHRARSGPRSGVIARLIVDRSGVSAIEFALIAPVMILIYFGLVEFCQAYMAERRAGHTAAMVADLVAQSDTTNKVEVDRVFAIGQMIMKPFPEGTLATRVSSITVDAAGVARVDWSRGKGSLTALTKQTVYPDLPAGLVDANETQSLILGETAYVYQSAFSQVLPQPITFRRKYYLRPRTVNTVPCADC
ncbi:TadE/TadG family type IV pilus assembly protein [Brevundimonas sp.]|uniref:TadE/TadG family type IV pilus assembly protein n=1 Tax=Brevundimonas sp. TaxID=1871086 RepID=UPI003D6CDFEE